MIKIKVFPLIILLLTAISPVSAANDMATIMYSLPGAEYIHKLPTTDGDLISSVDFCDINSLSLKEDRTSVGNRYKYVYGTAPAKEGDYKYIVHIKTKDNQEKQISVKLTVSSYLQSPTPTMLWLTWNWFARSISHDKMVDIAKGMQKYGLIDAGFTTILLDDAWATPQSDKAALTYDPAKFPQGIKGLRTALQKVNSKLKLGIYSDAGAMTCESYQPGSYLYEAQHIALFDSWGVDMLKYDYCNSEASTDTSYTRMGDAIRKLNQKRRKEGRTPFVYNICEWGSTSPWLWGAKAGGCSWRATGDAREDWIGNHGRPGVIGGVDEVRNLWMYAGVNHFNDLDMMCIGLHGLGGPSNNTMNHKQDGGKIDGLTDEQARTQMSLWCMLASPLALTCDLRENPQGEANEDTVLPKPLITKSDVEILTNKEIIAINQDPLGQQAEYMEKLSTGLQKYTALGYDVFVKDLSKGRIAVSVTNRSTEPVTVPDMNLTDLYLSADKTYNCHEIWSNKDFRIKTTLRIGRLNPCETKVFILTTAAKENQ